MGFRFFRRCEKTSPYYYVSGPNTLGIGVGNEALVRPHPFPPSGKYGVKYNVHDSINARGPTYLKEAVDGPQVSLRGNGVYLSGTIALQKLSDFYRK